MEPSDWEDEGDYPPAPLPAHERGWRHPSEVGAQDWAMAEPPLTIGRGLTAATGAVGILLAIAVLWTMLPTHGGSPVVSLSSQDDGIAAPVTTVQVAPSTTTPPPSTEPSVGTAPVTIRSTAPHTVPPVPTYHLASTAPEPQSAFVVAVNDGQLLLTTANAVSADSTVEVVGRDGSVQQATVLVVDERTGLAVLAAEAAAEVTSFAVAGDLQPGDELTVHGGDEVVATVGEDGSMPATLTPTSDLAEGTPVVNDRGELVGLCTHGTEGMQLVPVGSMHDLRRALASNLQPTVRLGVVVDDRPSGELTVAAIEPDGPAALAGVDVGDAIIAVDGEAVEGVDDLAGLLALHQPGDVVLVDLRCADGTALVVQVTLAPPKTSI